MRDPDTRRLGDEPEELLAAYFADEIRLAGAASPEPPALPSPARRRGELAGTAALAACALGAALLTAACAPEAPLARHIDAKAGVMELAARELGEGLGRMIEAGMMHFKSAPLRGAQPKEDV